MWLEVREEVLFWPLILVPGPEEEEEADGEEEGGSVWWRRWVKAAMWGGRSVLGSPSWDSRRYSLRTIFSPLSESDVIIPSFLTIARNWRTSFSSGRDIFNLQPQTRGSTGRHVVPSVVIHES